jgi:nicotinamidase-related amidase
MLGSGCEFVPTTSRRSLTTCAIERAVAAITVAIFGVALGTGEASAQVPIPTLPAIAAVTVDAKSTAYLVLDQTSIVCAPQPACRAALPAVAALLAKARTAGALVVFTETPTPGSTILPDVAPQPGEPKITGRADKFFATPLDEMLKAKGIKTVVIVGVSANGAVLYTAFEANLRGYTVVVAADGISADPFPLFLTEYQVLNQPGFANSNNTPLTENRVTLSRSDLITFR